MRNVGLVARKNSGHRRGDCSIDWSKVTQKILRLRGQPRWTLGHACATLERAGEAGAGKCLQGAAAANEKIA
jgi:hypothetical protein